MQSMTGYGRWQEQRGEWEATVELRAVNHRYLDVAMRLPRSLSFLEDVIRKELAALVRGHVDVYVTVRRVSGADHQVEVDEALAKAYAEAAAALEKASGVKNDVTVARLMSLEGVMTVTEAAMDEDAVSSLTADVTREAVRRMTEMRCREGESLKADLASHLGAVEALREKVASRAPGVVEDYRQRLTERLAKLPVEPVEPQRLAQEVALMADKCAIDEELSRLAIHIAQMRKYLEAQGETGKKMDFLIQEMNRESNTIGSKANDAFIAQCVVDLKSEIEKLREQIQNVV